MYACICSTYVCMHTYVRIMYASFAQHILNLLNISGDQFSEHSKCSCMHILMVLHCLSACMYFYLQNVVVTVSSHQIGIIIHQEQQEK